jgi:hypothetical protein
MERRQFLHLLTGLWILRFVSISQKETASFCGTHHRPIYYAHGKVITSYNYSLDLMYYLINRCFFWQLKSSIFLVYQPSHWSVAGSKQWFRILGPRAIEWSGLCLCSKYRRCARGDFVFRGRLQNYDNFFFLTVLVRLGKWKSKVLPKPFHPKGSWSLAHASARVNWHSLHCSG